MASIGAFHDDHFGAQSKEASTVTLAYTCFEYRLIDDLDVSQLDAAEALAPPGESQPRTFSRTADEAEAGDDVAGAGGPALAPVPAKVQVPRHEEATDQPESKRRRICPTPVDTLPERPAAMVVQDAESTDEEAPDEESGSDVGESGSDGSTGDDSHSDGDDSEEDETPEGGWFLHQVFGADETIIGHVNPRVKVYQAADTLLPLLVAESDAVLAGPLTTNLEGCLRPWLPADYETSPEKWVERARQERATFQPPGERVAEFLALPGNFATGSSDADDTAVKYSVFRCHITDPGARAFHHRAHLLTALNIETASAEPGGLDDSDKWVMYYVFEHAGDHLRFAGLATTHPFYQRADRLVWRLALLTVSPAHGRRGIGQRIYEAVFADIYTRFGDVLAAFTIEDPNPSMQQLRDRADLALLLDCQPAVWLTSGQDERRQLRRGDLRPLACAPATLPIVPLSSQPAAVASGNFLRPGLRRSADVSADERLLAELTEGQVGVPTAQSIGAICRLLRVSRVQAGRLALGLCLWAHFGGRGRWGAIDRHQLLTQLRLWSKGRTYVELNLAPLLTARHLEVPGVKSAEEIAAAQKKARHGTVAAATRAQVLDALADNWQETESRWRQIVRSVEHRLAGGENQP